MPVLLACLLSSALNGQQVDNGPFAGIKVDADLDWFYSGGTGWYWKADQADNWHYTSNYGWLYSESQTSASVYIYSHDLKRWCYSPDLTSPWKWNFKSASWNWSRPGAFIMDKDIPNKVPFKTTAQGVLKLHIFYPVDQEPDELRPAIVLYFGGGWVNFNNEQFYGYCRYFASRGLVAIAPEYRVGNVHGTSPIECVEDGKSSLRWIRKHALALGVDPDKIIAGGGSSGGQVAAAAGTLSSYDNDDEDLTVSSRPEALILLNAVVDNGPGGFGHGTVKNYWEGFSPLHNISEDTPPSLIMQGDNDHLVPVSVAEAWKSGSEDAGVRCDMIIFPGVGHGFFNNDRYNECLFAIDEFLASLGYLEGAPTVDRGTLP